MSHYPDNPSSTLGSGPLPGDRIDRSQETYEPSPHASRYIPPSGDVSEDGKRIYPQPSLSSRILVWGGIVAASAAATAGAVLAVRTVVDGVAGTDEDDAVEEARNRARARARKGRPPKLPRNSYAGRKRPSLAPRFAALSEDEREAIRERDRERAEADQSEIERQRRRARSGNRPRRRAPAPRKVGLLAGANQSIADVTETVGAAVATIAAAVEGFRSVAGQAGSIMTEFREAADTVKTMFDGIPVPSKPTSADSRRRADGDAAARDEERLHQL